MIKWCKQPDQVSKILQREVKLLEPPKKTELKLTKLTNVARASLEELRLDYEDFLRQRNLPIWDYTDPRYQDLIKKRLNTADQFALWAKYQQSSLEEAAANGMLVLLAVTCFLLDKQLLAQAKAFQKEGGLTERLYRSRTTSR